MADGILNNMNIYFSGIGGVGIGPLAEIALDAGYDVQGSDAAKSPITSALQSRGVSISFDQDGSYLEACHRKAPIDWLIHTAALPPDHPELLAAQRLGIKTAKRDELLAQIIAKKNLKLIAIAGTHGKTTTTGMLIWTLQQLGIPVSYSIGTTISFGPSGKFDPASDYFVYECDEYDRNFLAFHPYLSIITNIGYDHPDTYPTQGAYHEAFDAFIKQSGTCVLWQQDFGGISSIAGSSVRLHLIDKENQSVAKNIQSIALAGQHNRENAYLVLAATYHLGLDDAAVKSTLDTFPGTDRRFEKLAEGLYTDYGHHPEEIAATLQLARELSDHVVLVYQPHQNLRQHEVRDQYTDCFELAEEVYWLPTYLSREDAALPNLSPQELTKNITNHGSIRFAQLDNNLWERIQDALRSGKLVLAMGAGSIDGWLRQQLAVSAGG